MKKVCLGFGCAAVLGGAEAATVNWSASLDHGISTAGGSALPAGALVRIGCFVSGGVTLSPAQIQAAAANPAALDAVFVEAGRTTIGTGVGGVAGHFAAAANPDTASLNLAGRPIHVWILNAATVVQADQQAVLTWDAANTVTNPDNTPAVPGERWIFPPETPIPGITSIDLTDLTTGTSALADGARVVVGSFGPGTSPTTGATNFALAIAAAAPVITTASPLPQAVAGAPYQQTVTASGGASPYEFAVTGGALPAGLDLSSAGVLSGTPTATGAFVFTVQVTDAGETSGSKEFSLTVVSAPVIGTASPLPGAVTWVPMSLGLTASGGSAPLTWSLSGGALPSGLSLSAGGVLSGTPTAAGNFSFTVTVTDANTLTDEQVFQMEVTDSPFQITTGSTLMEGVKGAAYTQVLATTGGTAPVNWTLAAGSLPPGLTLNPTGVISGTPTTAGSYNFTLTATDGASLLQTKPFSLTVSATYKVPVVDAFDLGAVTIGVPFSGQVTATNYPKTFSISGLPRGLTYVAATGVISGRPLAAGTFTVKVRATNKAGASAFVTGSLIVNKLHANLVGSFTGIVARDPVNSNLGSRLTLTTTATGSYTLRITTGAASKSVTGYLGAAAPQISIPVGTASATLTLDTATNLLSGTHGTAAVSGWRSTWHTTTNPATSRVGYYSMAIDLADAADDGIAGIPQGSGYATFTVAKAGTLTVAGKTADGQTITSAGFMGPDGEIAVYTSLYANLGSIAGTLGLSAEAAIADNRISGPLTWSKPNNKSRVYKEGFAPLNLTVYGGFLSPKASVVVLGLPDTGTAALTFHDGGLSLAALDPDVAAFTYTATRTIVMPKAGSSENLAKATLSISKTTGLVTGAFTLAEPSPKLTRRVSFYGVIVRGAAGNLKAVGYFLLPQIPLTGQTIGNSPTLSGGMEIRQGS